MSNVNEQSSKKQSKKDSLNATRWSFTRFFSKFCPGISLIFLYFFNSLLHSFPHFRWFTTVLAVITAVEVLGVVKVGDDSLGAVGSDRLPQSQEEEEEAIQAPPFCFPPLSHRARDGWQMFVHVCMFVCVCWTPCVSPSVAAMALYGFQHSHLCPAAQPEGDGLLTPRRDRHRRFGHTHNCF